MKRIILTVSTVFTLLTTNMQPAYAEKWELITNSPGSPLIIVKDKIAYTRYIDTEYAEFKDGIYQAWIMVCPHDRIYGSLLFPNHRFAFRETPNDPEVTVLATIIFDEHGKVVDEKYWTLQNCTWKPIREGSHAEIMYNWAKQVCKSWPPVKRVVSPAPIRVYYQPASQGAGFHFVQATVYLTLRNPLMGLITTS